MERDFRYAPISPLPIFPPRVSDNNQNFFQHHHNHKHLQPLHPPPPPPPPPLRHPPRLPVSSNEEESRTQVYNLDHPPPPPPPPPLPHPPRVSDHHTITFDHHQPYIPSFYGEEHHHHHHHLHHRSDVWDQHQNQNENQKPPRFHPPVDDNHLNRPLQLPIGGWDHRDVNQFNHNTTVSSYRSDEYLGFDQNRFRDDHHPQEGRLFTCGEYSRDNDGYNRNQNQDTGSYHFHRHASPSSDNLASTSEHLGSRYGFPREDKESLWMNNGEEEPLKEGYRKWNSSWREPPAFNHSQLNIDDEEEMSSNHWVKKNGHRAFTGKRFPHQSNKSTASSEGTQELVRTPKKKVLRTSALLRVQLENPTNRKWREEKVVESNSGPSRGGPESVDLDVSFKSNGLVAKAKTVPSSSTVGSHKCKSNVKKNHNLIPVSRSSASHVTESHDGPINEDNSTRGVSATSRYFKGLTQSKDGGSRSFKGFKEFMDAVTDAGVLKVDSIGSTHVLDAATRSFKGSQSKDAGTDVGIVPVDNNSSQSRVNAKSQSKDAITDGGSVRVDTIGSQSCVVGKTQSKDAVTDASIGTVTLDNVGSQPCVTGTTQSKDEVTNAGVVNVDNFGSRHGMGVASRSFKGSTQSKAASLRSFKGVSQSNDAGVLKVDNSHGLDAASRSFKGLTPSKDAGTDGGIVAVDTNSSQRRVKRKRQSKAASRDAGRVVVDNSGSQPRVNEKTQSKNAVPDVGTVTVDNIGSQPVVNGISQLQDAGTDVGIVKVDNIGSTHGVAAASRSHKALTQSKDVGSRIFKGFTQSKDAVANARVLKVDNIGSTHGLDAASRSFKGLPPSKDAATDVGIVAVDSNSSWHHVNGETHSKESIVDVGSAIVGSISSLPPVNEKSQSQDTVVDVEIVTVDKFGSEPCINEINASLEHGRVLGSLPSSIAGSDGKCAPKIKKKRNRKKKVSGTNSGLSSRITEVHEGPVTGDSITLGADAPMRTDIALAVLEAKVTSAGADGKCAPKIKKRKRKQKEKLSGPNSCLSTLLTDVHDRPSNGDSTTRGVNATSSSNIGLRLLEAKVTDASSGAVENTGLQPFLNGVNVSLKDTTIKKSPSSHMTGSDGLCTVKVKTKKSLLSSTGFSSSRLIEFHNGSINAASATDWVDVSSSLAKGVLLSEEKIAVSGLGTTDDISLQPLCCSRVSLKNRAVVRRAPSSVMGSDDTPKTKKRNRLVNPLSGSTSSMVAEIREDSPNAVRSTRGTDDALSSERAHTHSEKYADCGIEIVGHVRGATLANGVNVALTFDKGLIQSKDNAAVSGEGLMDDISLETLNCSTVMLKNSAVIGLSPSRVMDVEGTPSSKKRKLVNSVSGSSRSMVVETDEEPLNAVCSTRDTDAALSSQKGPISSEEKLVISGSGIIDNVDSQPLPAVISPFEDSAVTKSPMSFSVASDGAYTPSSKQTNNKLPENADTSSNGTGSTSNSEKALMISEENPIVSNIVSVHSVGSQPLDGSTELLENRVEVGSTVVIEEDVRIYTHQNVFSSTFIDSNIPTVHSPPSGSKGSQHVVHQVVNLSCCQKSHLQNDFTELDTGGQREGNTELDAAEHVPFSRLSCEDIGSHKQMQEKLSISPLENRNSVLDERLACKALDMLVKDELLSMQNNVSSKAEASDVSIMHSNEGTECMSDRQTSTDSQQSLSMVPELDSLNSQPSHSYVGMNGFCSPENTSSTLNPNFKEKSDQAIQDHHLVPERTQSSPSQGTREPSTILRPTGGTSIGRSTHGSSLRQKVVPVRASPASSSLKVSSSSYIARPRTWNRTDNPSLSHENQYLKTGSSDGQSEKRFGKLQSTSYIRKGNSLVRKGTPVGTLSQGSRSFSNSGYQLNPLSRVEMKKSVSYEKKVNNTKPLNGLSTGSEKLKTTPLPHSTMILNTATKSCQEFACSTSTDPLVEGASEVTPNPTKLENMKDVPKYAGVSENEASVKRTLETQGISNDGKLKSPKMKNTIYVKRKSNQLVATRTEIRDSSVNVAEKSQAPPCSISKDQYYKRNKNQLIRNVPSVQNHYKQAVSLPDDNSNSEGQRAHKVASLKCNRNLSKQRPDRNLFPWRRMIYWRHNTASVSNKTSSSLISKKLLLSRKRDTVYTRSTGGFSLRKSKVLSIGGSNLKWSKSIEKRSKKANEEATLAVAAVEKKKRDQKTAAYAVARAKKRNHSSRERIFRIGSVRYRMDPSKRTLQRIPDEKSPSTVDLQSGKNTKKSFIPKRLLIGNDEYIRIGNGNQLVRDPKKRIRILASEKIRWSLHTARLRLARKQQYCQFFTRFGKCNKEGGKCPYIHDPAKIAVCTMFLKGLCSNTNCKLTHKVIPERMQDCSYFLQGLCTNENCPYRHVNVNPKASVCEGFLRGFCADGNECHKKHSYVCPVFEASGHCPQGSTCKLHHPRSRNKTRKRKRSKITKKTISGRYFGSTRLIDETGRVASDKHMEQNNKGITFHDGKFADYISLDVSDEEAEESNEWLDTHTTNMCDSDASSDLYSDIDEFIKPVALMNKKPRLDSLAISSSGGWRELSMQVV